MNTYIVEVKISLRKDILDVQGKAIEKSLHTIEEFEQLSNVKVGKVVTLDIKANSIEEATKLANNAANKLLANPVMEDFSVTVKQQSDI